MAFYRERGLRQLSEEIGTEGIGIGGGFIVGGVIGRQVENMLLKTPVTDISPVKDKLVAWFANNGAKAALYSFARRYDAKSGITREATKALAGSIVYDTILRIANHGYNPADVSLAGYRILGSQSMGGAKVQQLFQENTLLRTELNKALQKLASIPNVTRLQESPGYRGPDTSTDFKYGGAPSPAVEERQRQYGSMPWTPDVMERERRFGSMPFEQSQNVVNRQRRYGAMPFEQSPEKTTREKKYGFMSYAGETPLASFGMQ